MTLKDIPTAVYGYMDDIARRRTIQLSQRRAEAVRDLLGADRNFPDDNHEAARVLAKPTLAFRATANRRSATRRVEIA